MMSDGEFVAITYPVFLIGIGMVVGIIASYVQKKHGQKQKRD